MKKGKSESRILFVTRGRTSRGGHVVITNVVRELRREGYDVTLTTFESNEKSSKDVAYWNDIDVNFVEVPFVVGRDAEQIEHIEAASKYIEDNLDKFDKIVLDSWFIALAVMRKNIFSNKIFQLVQSDPVFIPENEVEFWKSELFNLLPLIPINRVVVSESLAINFEERYGKKFENIQLFIDDVFLGSKFEVKDRKVLKIVSSSATFNVSTKGLDFLLEQLEKIKDLEFELTLISGDKIKKDLGGYSFPIKIRSANSSKEMSEELVKHDVYVNTSTEEAFCLALAEAMAIGMPSIALDSVGNREYMDGKNAIFVQKNEDFIPGLLSMKDFEFRKKLSNAAKKSMQKFNLKNTVKELKEVIGI